MNYSEMTDFEINRKILEKTSGVKPLGYAHNADNRSAGIVKSNHYHWYDFCNSWADAGPIIEKENISLTCHQSRDEWAAIFNRHVMSAHSNPLRAAMECYLMKKERENAA